MVAGEGVNKWRSSRNVLERLFTSYARLRPRSVDWLRVVPRVVYLGNGSNALSDTDFLPSYVQSRRISKCEAKKKRVRSSYERRNN